MYRVRGSDQNVYGPIPAETIRQWIGERRLNRDSQVCRDGEEVWQPLGQVAEFADALSGSSPSAMPGVPNLPAAGVYQAPVSGVASREAILTQAKPAGICLIVFGSLMLLMAVVNVAMLALGPGRQAQQLPPESPEWLKQAMRFQTDMPLAVQYGLAALSMLVFAVVIFGGVKLLQLRARGLVMAAAILAMIPCFTSCCCILGLPLGIWVVVLINKPEVRSQFDQG